MAKIDLNTGRSLGISIMQMERYHGDQWYVYNYVLQYIQGNILDIACGTGLGTYCLSTKDTKNTITGIDIYNPGIEYANLNFKNPNLTYKQGDATKKLDIKDESFDTIISFETIEHLYEDERGKYLHELYRLLKNNGHMYLSTPFNGVDSFDRIIEIDPYDIYCHKLEFHFKQLKQEIMKAGLKIDEVGYIRRKGDYNGFQNEKKAMILKDVKLSKVSQYLNYLKGNIRKIVPEFIKNKIQDFTGNPFSIDKYEYVKGDDFIGAQTFFIKIRK